MASHVRETKRVRRKIDAMHILMRDEGFTNWRGAILETIEYKKKRQLIDREGFWIARLCTLTPIGFNIAVKGASCPGERNGFYSKQHKESTKELIRQQRIGSKDSPTTRRKKSEWQKGKTLTQTHRDNISAAWHRRTEPTKGKGKPKSAAHIKAIAAARKGSKLVDGHYVKPTNNKPGRNRRP